MLDFKPVLEEEQRYITEARKCYRDLCKHPPGGKEEKLEKKQEEKNEELKEILGLALSGGGVRSATFNLGVIQGLAELKLLKRFDYLSTVSGGGYIGSWLSAWCHRHPKGVCGVEQALAEQAKTPTSAADRHEPPEVSWLRQYSNYLTPRTGLFSLDTWTAIAFYLRNLLLNQTVLIAMLAVLLLLPRVLVFSFTEDLWWAFAWVVIGVILLLLTYVFTGCNLRYLESLSGQVIVPPNNLSSGHKSVVRFLSGHAVALLTLLAGLCVVTGWWQLLIQHWSPVNNIGFLQKVAQWVSKDLEWWQLLFVMSGGGAGLYFVLWIFALLARSVSRPVYEGGEVIEESMAETATTRDQKKPRVRWLSSVLWSLVTGAVGGLMLYGFHHCLLILTDPNLKYCVAPWLVAGPGVGLIVTLFLLIVVLHMGLVGRGFSTDIHEWWSRVGASVLLLTLGWVTLVMVVIFVPPTVVWLWNCNGGWIVSGAAGTWVASTLSGVLLGKSSLTNGKDANSWLERLVRITPYLFIAGLLITLACGLQALLVGFPETRNCNEGWSGFVAFVNGTVGPYPQTLPEWFWRTLVGCIVVLLLLSWRLDVNLFSLHIFYRNRLARCYLGASRQQHHNTVSSEMSNTTEDNSASASSQPRRPHPFTNLDPQDTPKLGTMKHNCKNRKLPQRPLHIINAALNLTAPRNLAWQERKATSFVFTPLHCGYKEPENTGCYQPTDQYLHGKGIGYLTLASALTVSGAAASPHQGYHTKPALAFLLTLFNVRLGWWIANPKDEYYWKLKGSAGWSLRYLLSELFGHASNDSVLVYLSDGGHFENLGIYELVRRNCDYIVAIDATSDPQFQFDDLGNAIRKIRTDFGIEIEIETTALVPNTATHLSRYHCAVGRIHYERTNPDASPGWLLYIKPSLTGDEPTDVTHYATTNMPFPHQSTKDQWFNESQFESYRKLGQHITTMVFQAVSADRNASMLSDLPLPELFRKLKERWYPPSLQVAGAASWHERMLDALYERLRLDSNLRFLDAQFYPEWPRLMKDSQYEYESAVIVERFDTPPIAVVKDNWYKSAEPHGFWLPPTYQERRAGFYFCHDLIHFMQKVYLDLNLQEHEAPDNRGWLNLFRQWSWSSMFRVSWAICASSCSARFQLFCETHLNLGFGTPQFANIEVTRLPMPKFGENYKSEQIYENKKFKEEFNPIELYFINRILLDLWKHNKLAIIHIYSLQLVVISFIHKPSKVEREANLPGQSEELRLTFGFAITYFETQESKYPEVIRYFRIQDHLRNMGLGHKALKKLLQHGGILNFKLDDYDVGTNAGVEADPRALRMIFDSAQSELLPQIFNESP